MAHETVHCVEHCDAAPDDIWRVIADFDVAWHPFVAQCKVATSPDGAIIRSFSAHDDTTILHERLTYISHSDRMMHYTLIDGIEGAQSYHAHLAITPNDTGSTIIWHAEVEAEPRRAKEIAAGTQVVFEAGIKALNTPLPREDFPTETTKCTTENLILKSTPNLGLTIAPKGLKSADTLCLMLHGIGGNRRNWTDQLTALGTQMPMVSLDLRGYGDSTLGVSQSKIGDYFDDIFTVMRHFKATKLVLCGLSYGAWIASSFALKHPEKIAGLILCGGCTGMSEAPPEDRDAFRTAREYPLNAGQTPADFADTVVNVIAGPSANQTTRDTLHASMAAIPTKTYRDALNCFCNPIGKLNFDAAHFPVLLMTGEHDRLAPPSEIRHVSQRFAATNAPFVNFEVITNAGHVCNLEHPLRVNEHLSRFLQMFPAPQKKSPKDVKKSEKRTRILNSALREFSKHGYSGASMAAIAKRAKVSKPTLYHYIGQKEDLFHAVLDEGRDTILAPFQGAQDKEMVSVLWDFSWAYADYVLAPDTLSIARLIIGEAERVPDIARQFHDAGPARALAGIATYLKSQRNNQALTFDDPDQAGEHLWSLILSGPRNHAFHFPHELPNQATVHRSILSGLRAFLLAYSTNIATDILALNTISRHHMNTKTI